ncbi:MAG: hypothetical protein ACFCU9_03545 [Cyanophyceae cyanobacterium]
MKQNYELWLNEDGHTSMFPSTNHRARTLLDPGAKQLLTFEAESMEEACQIEYSYFGWGTYKPMGSPSMATDGIPVHQSA